MGQTLIADMRLLDGKLQVRRAGTMGCNGATWVGGLGEWEDVLRETQANLDKQAEFAVWKAAWRAKARTSRPHLLARIFSRECIRQTNRNT